MGLPRVLGDPSGAAVLPAVAFALLGSALARRVGRGESSLLPPRVVTFASAFLALAAGSAVASSVRGETWYLLLRGRTQPVVVNVLGMTAAERTRDALLVFLGFVLLLLALDAFSRLSLEPDGRDRLLLWTCLGGAAALVLAAVQRLLRPDPASPWTAIGRGAGTFTDPNALGVGIGLLVPLFLAALVPRGVASDRVRRGLAAIALVAAPAALEASGSRTGLLLLVSAGLAAFVGLVRLRRVPPLALAATLAALVGAGVFAVRSLPRGGSIVAGGLWERLGAAVTARSFSEVANHRVMFWRAAFEMTEEEPLSGVGLGGFPYEFPPFWEKHHAPIAVTDGATNALLDMAAECGLPGLLLALLAAVPLLGRGFDAAFARGPIDPASRAAGAAVAGLFIACQTGSHTRFFEIGLLTALAVGFVLVPRRSSRDGRVASAPLWRPGRTAGILAAAGILAGAFATAPTLRPEAAFPVSAWAGVYKSRGAAPGLHWSAPLAYRLVRPGERDVSFRVLNPRPDGRAVRVSLDVDGQSETSLELAGGETRDVTVPVPAGGRVLRLRVAPGFVPRDLGAGTDARRLGVRVSGEGL
jgi:O-antigen ligase